MWEVPRRDERILLPGVEGHLLPGEAVGLLRGRGVALCVADAEDDLKVPFVATADWGYRLLRRPEYDDAALEAWAARMSGRAWRECFVFFKHEDAGRGPEMASRLL